MPARRAPRRRVSATSSKPPATSPFDDFARGVRSAGVLMHVTSLPSAHGIGDLGPAAFEWVDLLAEHRVRWWQMLPLGPTGYGESPYQPTSSFAGNPMLISPEALVAEKLLDQRDLAAPKAAASGRVDYSAVAPMRRRLLTRAWERFRDVRVRPLRAAFARFHDEHGRAWLDDFCLFAALKRQHAGQAYWDWPEPLRRRAKAALAAARRELAGEVDQVAFEQFLVFRQCQALHAHAAERGVGIIGDVPIFVSPDSADVWSRPELFQLDRDGRPSVVAGVPPDLFSADGQRWGNPHYAWREHERTEFRWWTDRVRHSLTQVDLLRVDHFRGFAAAWEVQASSPNARKGRWVPAPGHALLAALVKALDVPPGQPLPLIAEDLGLITPDVLELRDAFRLPGMKILQFAWSGGASSPDLPHHHTANAVAYTGTHDNDTTLGWYRAAKAVERRHVWAYVDKPAGSDRAAVEELTRLAMASPAKLAVVPVQDLLGLGSEARMNTPGTTGGTNWQWHLGSFAAVRASLKRLKRQAMLYGR
ncbi:MAG TPA: 4-alpha-glucanotransferase [Tepidisphaeraceae bacterium]|nr:4-alpha-glucanotransferase [Tepidisphaeraceae bacterium]